MKRREILKELSLLPLAGGVVSSLDALTGSKKLHRQCRHQAH
jgi:hypothetical protein